MRGERGRKKRERVRKRKNRNSLKFEIDIYINIKIIKTSLSTKKNVNNKINNLNRSLN